ncbi:MAG: alpha/beta fold hydrolase [bacterium]|nr:alpha/beta fold hydrolase [bacterium]
MSLSPKGSWAVALAVLGDKYGLLVQKAAGGRVHPVIAIERPFTYYAWVDDDTLIVTFDLGSSDSRILIDLSLRNGEVVASKNRIQVHGHVVDPLPTDDDHVLWSHRSSGDTYLLRLPTVDLLGLGNGNASRTLDRQLRDPVLKLQGAAYSWITDLEGEPQVVVRPSREGDEILIGRRRERGGAFSTVYRYLEDDDEEALRPVALVPGTRHFYALGLAGKDTIGLHEFDPDDQEIVREVYRRDDVDVTGVVVDPLTRDLIAVESMVEGERSYFYMDGFFERYTDELQQLSERLPIDSVRVRSVSADRNVLLLHQWGATEPGRFLNYFVDSDQLLTTGEWRSDIDRERLAKTESFRVASKDGLEIEAYITLPSGSDGPHPLVVMPHGGPHGARDVRLYDPRVQYLASWGFAVLQPNYRGSSGYGREYFESIKKQWAKAIEDDIDAAVEHAIGRPEIDGDRICIVGGSYGGFSALASVVRHRDRYRCAISMNGVSDIPLLYDSSDMADSKRVMDFYEEYVGDVETERELLEAVSPAYNVESIDTPILFIYGDRDRRVDPDHSHRMMLMMDLLGKPYESIEIETMRHRPTSIQWVIVMRSMRRMLTRNLFPGRVIHPDPDIGGAGVGRLKHRLDLDL